MQDKPKPQFSKGLFWDSDQEQIDVDEHNRYIIERVTLRGSLDDWLEIKKYYGIDKIKGVILDATYLDERSWDFFSKMFKIPKEEFKCYTRKQWNQGLWPY